MNQAPATQQTKDPQGRDAGSPWHMPLTGWKQALMRTWAESSKDNVALVAAGVAFYGFLALVPMLGAVVLTYGIAAEPETVLRHVQSLTTVLPSDIARLLGEQLMNVVQTSGGKKGLGLVAALAIALWGARNSAGAMISALNIAYEEEEKRSFLRVTLLTLAMTVAGVLMALLAVVAATVLGYIHELLPQTGAFGRAVGRAATFVLLGVAAAAAVAALYRYAPSRARPRWEWLTPGCIFAALGWLILTVGFGFYVANFGNYGATYGSLSAVIVLLTWMYLSSYVLLFGAELNAELEHQTARDTTEGAPRPLGSRGAWAADNVAGRTANEGGRSGPAEDQQPSVEPRPAPVPAFAREASAMTPPADEPSGVRRYVTARAVTRVAPAAGVRRVSMLTTALATLGLGLMRRRGREAVGAALLAGAGALSLARRD